MVSLSFLDKTINIGRQLPPPGSTSFRLCTGSLGALRKVQVKRLDSWRVPCFEFASARWRSTKKLRVIVDGQLGSCYLPRTQLLWHRIDSFHPSHKQFGQSRQNPDSVNFLIYLLLFGHSCNWTQTFDMHLLVLGGCVAFVGIAGVPELVA